MAENVTSQELTHRQRRALDALMTCPTIRAAARKVRISERQLYRWLDDESFTAELRRAEGEALAGAVRRLTSLSANAIQVLSEALDGGAFIRPLQVRAAGIVLDKLKALREFAELEARIAAVEQALKSGEAK